MCRTITLCLLSVSLWCASASSLAAQDAALEQMYGSGVHAYFAGRHAEAHENFTTAIEAGSTDPRCHYYRGLSYLRLGRPDEAKADFARGAELESQDSTRYFGVSQALERIQGRTRLMLEQHRRRARALAASQLEPLRYQTGRPTQPPQENIDAPPVPPVIEESPAVPPVIEETPAAEAPLSPPKDEPAEEMPDESPPDDPFSEEQPADEKPAEELPPPQDDEPAEEEPAEPKDDDPFAPPAEEPAEEEPADEKPADDNSEEEPLPPAEESDADDPPPPDEDDPFADDEPAEEEPAEESDDPPPPEEDDPFAEEEGDESS